MDVRYFLHQRLAFLRQLHTSATAPYVERKRKIEAEEEPFASYYDESGEPPYLEEWLEADESIQVLGRACISMLASALHVYFITWEHLIGAPKDKALEAIFKNNGWLQGYEAYFSIHSCVPFDKCPVNLELLEELVLARNRVQHPDSITTDSSSYSKADIRKLQRPYFVDEDEFERLDDLRSDETNWLLLPTIKITPEKFELAVRSVEEFAEWLETVETLPPETKNDA